MALGLYTALAGLGVLWSTLADRGIPILSPSLDRPMALETPLAWSLGAGIALAILSLSFSAVAVRHWVRYQRLQDAFAEMLAPLSHREVWVFTLSSSIAEELFFRVGMQPSLGLWPTALIFGAIHFIPRPEFRIWTPWAIAMGVLLGAIFEYTGVAAGAILAHGIINYVGLRGIAAHADEAD